jgi:hypothetical protein
VLSGAQLASTAVATAAMTPLSGLPVMVRTPFSFCLPCGQICWAIRRTGGADVQRKDGQPSYRLFLVDN